MIYSHVDCKGVPLQNKLNEIMNKRNGFFIELGANDGLKQSNTAFFEKEMGWNGILIEPSLEGYEKCKINRKNSICLNYACVSNDYPVFPTNYEIFNLPASFLVHLLRIIRCGRPKFP